jgi:hypothetical protein
MKISQPWELLNSNAIPFNWSFYENALLSPKEACVCVCVCVCVCDAT